MINKLFHTKRFWKWMFFGLLQGFIILMVGMRGLQYPIPKNGLQNDLWSTGNIKNCILMIINNNFRFSDLLSCCSPSKSKGIASIIKSLNSKFIFNHS